MRGALGLSAYARQKDGIVPHTINGLIDLVAILPGFALHAVTFPFVLFFDHFYATAMLLFLTAILLVGFPCAAVLWRWELSGV